MSSTIRSSVRPLAAVPNGTSRLRGCGIVSLVRSPWLLSLATALGALAPLLLAPTADAHPFGPPQTAAVDLAPGTTDTVRVRWRVGGDDDLALLGVQLGVLPPDRVMADGASFYTAADGETLMASTEFATYLVDTVQVRNQDGTQCPGTLEPSSGTALAQQGVSLHFACDGPVENPDVTITTLTDLHPAYRTLASGPSGQKAVYTSEEASHGWRLGDGPGVAQAATDPADSAAMQLGLVGGGVALAGLVGWQLRRRSRRVR